VLCELLAQPDNRVTLSDEVDRHGLRVAKFTYSQCENDRAMIEDAKATSREILEAAGAQDVVGIDRYAHLIGGARMGTDPTNGVVDRDLRSFAIPNLYVTDGSTLPTQGAANPALTIMALAARCADHLSSGNRAA
jgi:choline dehydrogenase-like flavoprotein